ncbi:hypothetical protein WJX77_010071 [Trebouxia sp. C0004]
MESIGTDAELDKKVSYEGRTGKNKKQKREQGQTPPASRAPAARPINDKEQEELDVKLLRLLIMNSLPFDAVESPWMLDFCHSLKPSYVPAGASKLQTTVLTQEYLKSRAAFTARLAQEHNLSVSIDLWRSNSNQPVYACKVAFSDGSVFLLGAKELPGAAGTAEDVAGIVKEWLKMLGPEKVGSLSTDEIGTLTEARHLVVSTPGFTHIVDFRCPVHALVLAVLAMLASEPVNALICNAHMMASRFHASSAASAFLADEAKELGINAELLPCNLSQVQSVHECLQSLVQMEHAIKQMLQKHPDFPMNQAVTECANSVSFWSQIAKFCKLLAPITDVVKGNMSKTSSLADVMLHWLHLARSLQAAETEANLPHDVTVHCFAGFNQRAAELDSDLCRLALFLDPRYKDIAVPQANPDTLFDKARSVFQNRRHGVEECDRLSQQLQLYLVRSPPFDQPFTPQTSAKAWWLNLGSSHTSCTELRNLAVFMCTIVPHAASAERVSSIMGWYHTPVRSQLDVDSLARVVALKTHLQHHVPRVPIFRLNMREQQVVAGPLLLDVPPLGANPSSDQLMDQLYLFSSKASRPQSAGAEVAKTELLMAAQYNLSHPALLSASIVQAVAPAPQHVASLSAPRVNANEFVRTCFAEMGRKL